MRTFVRKHVCRRLKANAYPFDEKKSDECLGSAGEVHREAGVPTLNARMNKASAFTQENGEIRKWKC